MITAIHGIMVKKIPLEAEVATFITSTGLSSSNVYTEKSIPGQVIIDAINRRVNKLKAAGLYSKYKVWYPVVGGTAAIHAKNLVNPSSYSIAFVGGVTHASKGIVFDGTTGYGNTGIALNALVTKDDWQLSFFSQDTATGYSGFKAVMGVFSGGNTGSMYLGFNGDNFSGLQTSTTIEDKFAMLSVRYTGGKMALFKGADKIIETTVTQSSAPSIAMFLGCFNSGGTPTGFVGLSCAEAIVHAPFTDAEMVTHQQIVDEYQFNMQRGIFKYSRLSANHYTSYSYVAGYIKKNAFVEIEVDTEATKFDINARCVYYNPPRSSIAMFINGQFYSEYTFTAIGTRTFNITGLPVGRKTIRLVEGTKSADGNFITSITNANKPIVEIPWTPVARRLVVAGDSIFHGFNQTSIWSDSVPMALRNYYPDRAVTIDGGAGLSLWGETTNNTAVTAYVARLVSGMNGVATNEFILQLGTNDYGNATCSAANFQTCYAAVLDAIHTAKPDAIIYCLHPFLRLTETANSFSNILDDYRNAITTVCSTRAWANNISASKNWITLADLADGLHPTTIGANKIVTQIRSLLGV